MTSWPLQSRCDEFYGNPRGGGGGHVNEVWYRENIMLLTIPFEMKFGLTPVHRVSVHRKCAESLARVFAAMKIHHDAGLLIPADYAYDGSFNYRTMRKGRALSMHAYGCAIDLDAAHNPMGRRASRFRATHYWVRAFEAEGWTWGGRWRSPDAMHFQAAVVG